MSAMNFHNFLIFFLPLNSRKCKLQLALICRDSYINIFLGQSACGESLENTVFLLAIILLWQKLFVEWKRKKIKLNSLM